MTAEIQRFFFSDNFGRRSGKERRRMDADYDGEEKRSSKDRRSGIDRRGGLDRRTGVDRRIGQDRRRGKRIL